MSKTKRVVVAGCRNYNNYQQAKEFIDACLLEYQSDIKFIIVSGGARGADALGERYAIEKGFEIERYPANWAKYGKSAGPRRNEKMAEICDLVICFWDGQSRGTKSMIEYATRLEKLVHIKEIDKLDFQ